MYRGLTHRRHDMNTRRIIVLASAAALALLAFPAYARGAGSASTAGATAAGPAQGASGIGAGPAAGGTVNSEPLPGATGAPRTPGDPGQPGAIDRRLGLDRPPVVEGSTGATVEGQEQEQGDLRRRRSGDQRSTEPPRRSMQQQGGSRVMDGTSPMRGPLGSGSYR